MRRRSLWWFIGLVTLCTALGSAATAAELSGREIVQRMETIDTVQDLIAELEMRIIHKSGMERVRHVSLATKRSPDGTEKALFRFLQPSDVKGTAFLSISRPGSPDENWLYLPALGKPRRIASEESGGSFMGSDFTYADIGSMRIDDFHHTLLRSETLENEEVYVVESVPASDKVKREVGFARRIWWVRKASFTLARAEFFSAAGRQFKVLRVWDLLEIGPNAWLATQMEMKNTETGSRTVLTFRKVKANTGNVPDDLFTLRQLTRTN